MSLQPQNKLQCVIIDDEIASQRVIEHFIKETEVLELVKSFSDPNDAYKFLQLKTDIDIVFLDINMPQQSGLDFYKSLSDAPDVIFTTAYREHAVEGFELNAVDYLLKPIRYDRFLKAIRKVIKGNTGYNSKEFIVLKENKTIYKVATDEILYVEAFGDYVKVITEEKSITTHSTFSKFIKKLPDHFVRIHKSYCINSDFLVTVSGNRLTVSKISLPIGLTFKTAVLKILKINP